MRGKLKVFVPSPLPLPHPGKTVPAAAVPNDELAIAVDAAPRSGPREHPGQRCLPLGSVHDQQRFPVERNISPSYRQTRYTRSQGCRDRARPQVFFQLQPHEGQQPRIQIPIPFPNTHPSQTVRSIPAGSGSS